MAPSVSATPSSQDFVAPSVSVAHSLGATSSGQDFVAPSLSSTLLDLDYAPLFRSSYPGITTIISLDSREVRKIVDTNVYTETSIGRGSSGARRETDIKD